MSLEHGSRRSLLGSYFRKNNTVLFRCLCPYEVRD